MERIIFPTPSKFEARSGTLVELDIGEKSAAVISVHLSFEDLHVQENQLDFLKNKAISLRESNSLVIIGGDFNAGTDSTQMIDFAQAIGRKLTEDLPLTYPSVNPDRTIDFLFALDGESAAEKSPIKNLHVITYDPGASDHLPLTGELPDINL